MGSTGLRVGRIAGVEVRISLGLVALAAFFSFVLAVTQYPRAFPGHSAAVYWLLGLTTTALFVGSILAHELGHAVAAQGEDVVVEGITLWVFGGYARLASLPTTAAGEARIALSGPAATGLCAGLFWMLAIVARPEAAVEPSMLVTMFDWLSRTNLLLLAVNLLPALPLDGGRVVSATVWGASAQRDLGQTVAARCGWLVGAVLAFVAIRGVLDGRFEGLWALLIAFVVFGAAQDHERHRRLRRWWQKRSASEVMRSGPPVVDAWMSIDAVLVNLAAHPGSGEHPLLAVRGADGHTLGVIVADAARAVPVARRRDVRAVDLLVPSASPLVVDAGDGVASVVAAHPDVLRIGVVVLDEGGRPIGVVRPQDLLPRRTADPG